MGIVVGTEYVVGTIMPNIGFIPCRCNNGARIVVLKTNATSSTAMASGSKKPQRFNNDGLYPVDVAKGLYRQTLEAREARWLAEGKIGVGQEKIDQLVAGL